MRYRSPFLGLGVALGFLGCSSSGAVSNRVRLSDAGADTSTLGTGGNSGSPSTGSGGAGKGQTDGGGTISGGDTGAQGSDGGGPRVSDFVGVNAFIDDDVVKLAAIGNVREYHDWTWNDGNGNAGYPGYPNNQLAFSLFGGSWDFDAYYSSLKKAGSLVFPCIQGSVEYLKSAMPPVASGKSETDPASYVAHASFLYQYAARYGTVQVAATQLKLASDQTAKSGLGLLPYYENGNEPDATWVKPDGSALFSPAATAAMTSADYDGHRGNLGPGFGIKGADPHAKLVLAGLAGAGSSDWVTNVTTYLDGIRTWSAANRGGSFPADVINVHDYCFGPDPFGTANPRPGLSPEECGLGALLAKIAAYRDAKLPGKELWLTEFGYDTHPKSRLRAPAIGLATAEMVQGQWLVRSILALLESGIDRAFLFVSRDSCTGMDAKCPDNAVQFSTSGVLAEKGDETPKAAFYYLATFRNRLGPLRYLGTVPSGNGKVSIARFYDAGAGKGAYVVWAPTSNGTVVDGYPLAIAAGVTTASAVSLADKSMTGVETTTTISGGKITTKVTETPTIVLVNGRP